MAFFGKKLGIDLGTTETIIYRLGVGIVLREPTVVAMDIKNKKVLAMGEEAKQMLGKTPGEIVAYTPIKDGAIADYKVTEQLLHYFITKVLGNFSMFKPEVMISIPSSISSTERRAVMEAVLKAGAKEVFVIKEPVLSAVGAGVLIHEPKGRMVMNIGGGTTDVAIISLGGVVSSKSIKYGGDRLDQTISDVVKKNHGVTIGLRTAANIKHTIGSAMMLKDDKAILVKGRDLLTGLPKEVKVTVNEISAGIKKDIEEIAKVAVEVFTETPPELASDIMEHGILLTGAGAQLQNLPEFLEGLLRVKSYVADEPDLCVIKGMGIVLAHLDNYKRSVISKKAV
jgi:rod shape-determining protein MreB and related proteins